MYARVSGATASRARYVSDTCGDAEVFRLPQGVVEINGGTFATIAVDRPSQPAFTVYLALETTAPVALSSYGGTGTVSVCASCDDAAANCTALPFLPASVQVSGGAYLKWDERPGVAPYSTTSFWMAPG
jgi:hypothetical protein